MAFTTIWNIAVQQDSTLAADKQWKATVMLKPGTAAATPTTPDVTTGPLGSSGSAAATRVDGAGNAVGFSRPEEAIEKAMEFVANDYVLGNQAS